MDKPLVSDAISEDFEILDGKTDAEISAVCHNRAKALRSLLGTDWPKLEGWLVRHNILEEIPNLFYSPTNRLSYRVAPNANELLKMANYALDGIRSNPDLSQYVPAVADLKPFMRTCDVEEKGDNAIDKSKATC